MTVARLCSLNNDCVLDETIVRQYRENGHVRVRAVATREEAATYRPVISQATSRHNSENRPLAERDTYGKAFLQVTNLWRRDNQVAKFVLARRFASAAAQLLGVEKVRLYHDQALYKEPGGGPTPWHQDSPYWPFETDLSVTMWMPLVDMTPEMGGMSFASGTHRDRSFSDHSISDESEEYFDTLLDERAIPIVDPIPMRAGDATFHAGWTVHRALPNRSRTVREVMTIIWVADGVSVAQPHNTNQEKDMQAFLPGLAPGDPVASELNPRLPV